MKFLLFLSMLLLGSTSWAGSCLSVDGEKGYGTCTGLRAYVEEDGCLSVAGEKGYEACAGFRAYPESLKVLKID